MGTLPINSAHDGTLSTASDAATGRSAQCAGEPVITRGFHFYAGEEKFLIRGIAYGPFRPNEKGVPYPTGARLHQDLQAIVNTGANVIRLYAPPDDELVHAAHEHGLRLLIDIPWPTHIDVYHDANQRQQCLAMVRDGITRVKHWPNLLGVFLGNEIPPDLLRWSGERTVRRFLRRLYTEAKSMAPDVLVGFANYPSTEYLRLDIFDFIGFNIYLENPETFRNYLVRLRHLYPEKPLVISECGLDSLRSSEDGQARFLESSLAVAYEAGAAGAVVFSWTDEWHTGGFDVEGWAFGIVDAERNPKPARAAVRQVFQAAPQCRKLQSPPPISVVVATYNGASTLRTCLRSLADLRYPDYEIIVVDDGSTDDTARVLTAFPEVKVVRQENQGLSAARNAGIQKATGELIAFTDSDCYVDPDWLYHLALAFQDSGHAGMGGPNLTPREDGPWQRAVALAPGHATHVLLDFDEAEHVPGCNMAFRRDVLETLGGFDPQFRKAGDDVDLVWRLRDLGHTVGFCPSAFVWHRRRATLSAYWKQHFGYGEAEGLLVAKHPHRFNERGESLWRGTIYPGDFAESPFTRPDVHYGVFGSAGYQCIYERPAGLWIHLFTSLEWWILCTGLLILGFLTDLSLLAALAGFSISLTITAARAWRRWNRQRRESAWVFFPLWLLWTTQPLVRAAARYRTRLGLASAQDTSRKHRDSALGRVNSSQSIREEAPGVLAYWGESGVERVQVLRALGDSLARHRWVHSPNSEWEPWDLSVVVSWWYHVRVTSAAENHGGKKRLLRLRFRLVPGGLFGLFAAIAALLTVFLAFYSFLLARCLLIGFLLLAWLLYWRARKNKVLVQSLADKAAREAGYLPLADFRDAEAHRITSSTSSKTIEVEGRGRCA